jgi:uncharacterized membrane protein YecN with MAPEG domain
MLTEKNTAEVQSASRASRAIGSMFFSVFGGCWLVVWSLGAYGVKFWVLGMIGACSAAILLVAVKQFRDNRVAYAKEAESLASKKAGRIFNVVNAIQWVLIFIVSTLLKKAGHWEWIIPSVILIVGVHFFPLGVAFRVRRHYLTGGTLVLVAVLYPLMAKSGPKAPVGCLGTGIILWLSAIGGLIPRLNPKEA